jgi:uncharacterized membrane protein
MKYALSRLKFKALILFVAVMCCAHATLATTVIIPADDDMIIGARAIVRGKVLSVASAYDSQQDRVFTYITVKVQEVLKGNITERRIVIKELGGQAGDRALLIFGSPRFTPGEETLLYLDTWPDGSLQTHQMFLGKFNIVRDPETGKKMVVRSSPDEETQILQWQPHGGHTHGPSTEKMGLSAYLRMVRERLAANWERSVKFEEQYYSGVPVLSEPSEYDGIARRGGLEAQFTLLGNFRFFQPDSGQPVPLIVGTAPPESATVPVITLDPNDMAAAGGAWSNVSGSALQVSYTGTFSAACYTTGSPGIFVVWNNCDGKNTPTSGCASTLAWGGIASTGFQTRTIGGVTFRQTVTGFVSFNPWAACNFTNPCNVREIATHEIGHALGLNHSQDSSATMAAFAHFDGRCASIRADDQDGIRFIYPGTGGGGALSITTSSLASGTVGTAYSQTLVASGGTTPYVWSLAAGSGGLPAGLTLNSNGTISGTPSTAGTFNFTVQVNDSAQGTAQKALSITINPSGGGYNSQFVSQNTPTSLSPGQQFTVNFSWTNNGSQTWSGSGGFHLRSQNPAGNTTWGTSQIDFTGSLLPGQTMNSNITFIAPTTPGTYNFQWQTYQDGVGYFGQASTNVSIQVGASATDNAAFVTQSVPSSMTAGQSYAVSVTMQNTGTTTWAAGSYQLGSQNPQDNTTWGLNRVSLAGSVAPGASATFTFNVTAPATAGTYNFQWRMVNGATFFGAASTNVAVSVTSGGGGGGGPYNAAFVSQVVPSSMTPGQIVSVSVTMRNTGTQSWSSISGITLRSQNPAGNTTWGVSSITLTKFVASGSQFTFTFTVTAPATPGTYNFQWQLYRSSAYFGQASTNLPIQVGTSGGGTDNASFVTQSVSSSMTAGQSYSVSVTMQNTGTTTWAAGSYQLGSQNPQDNTTWGLNRVSLAGSVAPGASATFTFNVTAPATAGTYNFQWRMVNGTVFFGAASTNVAVSVTSGGGGGGTDNASFVTQSVSSSMTAGQSYAVSVTMQNTGTTTWTAGTYRLGSQNPQDNLTWGLNRVNLASSVAPGASATFTFNVTAPATAGTYNFQWRMVNGATFFGAASTNIGVNVTSSGAAPPPSITTTSLPNGVRNSPYSAQVQASGGTLPLVWSLTGAPSGLTINSTGRIAGTPTVSGIFNMTVTVRDASNRTASRTFKVFIQ